MPDHHLDSHPFFEPWTDPVSGVVSYILTERVAPVQMVTYFVNPAVSADEKWLWFSCGYPPSPYKRLGVVSLDPANPVIKVFQEATFQAETPLVSESGDSCLYACGTGVYEVNVAGEVRQVLEMPAEILKNRVLQRMATHLTKSADGKYLLLDVTLAANRWFVALGDLETGEVRVLKQWTRHMNHAQFSPVDPELFLISQDWWHDAISGEWYPFDQRIWLMDTKGTRFEPLRPTDWFGHGTLACHEWWDKQGRVCWVDYEKGVFRVDLATRELESIWPRQICHAHCDATGRFWCGDESPYKWAEKPCQVLFYDAATGRETAIASGLPQPCMPRSSLHLDPHPHFSPQGTFVAYMTTVHGRIDVALTPVEPLLR